MRKKQKRLFIKGEYHYIFKSGNTSEICKTTIIRAGNDGVTIGFTEYLHKQDTGLSSNNDRNRKKRYKSIDDMEEHSELFRLKKRRYNQKSIVEIQFLKQLDEEMLQNTLQTLSSFERNIITYIYYKALSQAEIAEIIGKNQSSVSRLHQKTIKKLRLYFNSHKVFKF